MNITFNEKLISLLVLLLFQSFYSQEKKDTIDTQNIRPSVSDTIISLKVDSFIVSELKNDLYDLYKSSSHFEQKELKNEEEKQILGVGWYDSKFNKVESIVIGEKITIAVLTKGYKIGDKIEVSIGSDDKNSESLLENEKCNMITFIGQVNYENLSILQNVFKTEGEKEFIVVSSEWLDKYNCK